MKPLHLALIAGVGFLLLKRNRRPVVLPPVTVYAPTEKPIPFPTEFRREVMPLPPTRDPRKTYQPIIFSGGSRVLTSQQLQYLKTKCISDGGRWDLARNTCCPKGMACVS